MVISDIMSRNVEFISPDATVQEAAALLGELDYGALPVGAPDDLQGVITSRDILFRVVAAGRSSSEVRVREVMSGTVFTCREGDTLGAALDIMADYQVRRLPIRNEAGLVVGWITLSDIASRLIVESEALKWALDELTATEAVE